MATSATDRIPPTARLWVYLNRETDRACLLFSSEGVDAGAFTEECPTCWMAADAGDEEAAGEPCLSFIYGDNREELRREGLTPRHKAWKTRLKPSLSGVTVCNASSVLPAAVLATALPPDPRFSREQG